MSESSQRRHSAFRVLDKIRKGILDFLGELVGEVILAILSCLVLLAIGFIVILSWRNGYAFFVGAAVLFAVGTFFAVKAYQQRRLKKWAMLLLTVCLALLGWVLLYGVDCVCWLLLTPG